MWAWGHLHGGLRAVVHCKRQRVPLWIATPLVLLALVIAPGQALADPLPDTAERVKASVVSIATYQPTRSPRAQYLGTGFVIDDGRLVVTNDHVLPGDLDQDNRERLVVVSGQGRDNTIHHAEVVARAASDDLVLLRIAPPSLPALTLGNSSRARVGEEVAFTGYPIGMILGLYPATHRAGISAMTPMAIPARHSSELDDSRIRALRNAPPMVFQLDATAYPGNSGSPLYRKDTGEVIGVINQVYVQGGREAAVRNPSGITYAIPSDRIRPLLEQYRSRTDG